MAPPARNRIFLLATLLGCAFLVGSALADLGDVASHFRAARYQDARDALEVTGDDGQPGEAAFWRND